MTSSDLDLRLQRFRSRRDEYPHALASALIEASRSNDALEVIHLGLLDDENNLELLTLEGRAFYVLGDLQEAQRSLLRAAKVDPKQKEPYRWLAQVLIERGDAVRAVQVLERAIGLDPNDAGLRQAYARAQRMAGAAAARKGGSQPAPARASMPRSSPSAPPPASKSFPPPAREPAPAAAKRPSTARESLPAREPAPPVSERPRSTTPSALGPAAQKKPENQNAKRGAISDLVARASSLRKGSKPTQDSMAEDLMREPLTDPGSANPALPYGGDTDRDDESPTTAVEVPEEVRSWLRGGRTSERAPDRVSDRAPPSPRAPERQRVPSRIPEQRPVSERPRPFSERPRPFSERPPRPNEQVLASDDDDDDELSVPTSIVPAHQELEALRRRESMAPEAYDDRREDSEATLIAQSRELLAEPGQAEPPEQVLSLLQTQGVFETGSSKAVPQQGWLGNKDVPRVGTRVRRALGVAWGVAIVAALGGYYGFTQWLEGRREEAQGFLAEGTKLALDGQHESLLLAERQVMQARTLDPKSDDALRELLFVQAARAFDDANGDFSAVRNTLARAQQNNLVGPMESVAKVLVLPVEQRKAQADALISIADREALQDWRATYVAARVAQHAGQLDATKRLLTRALSLEPKLALAHVALGEQARADGELERAYAQFDQALGDDRKDLRAELWLAVLEAKGDDVSGLKSKLAALMPRVEKGSDADKLLAHSAEAMAATASGELDQAKQALRVASALHVDDPELLAFLSEQALRAGEHTLAYRAARAASDAGGDAPRFQPVLAAALLQQGSGDAALTALANVGEGHGALALARATAALLTNSRESLEAAKKELASYRATPAGREDAEASALLIRVDLRLGASAESLLPATRALAQRASDVAAAQLALAEAQLAAGQAAPAMQTLDGALKLSPGSADAQYLMGRAQLIAGKPTDARTSFERAVAIAPNHVEAQRALGRSLLDNGDFDAALTLFKSLESTAGSSATLGSVEALLEKGNLTEAASKLDGLPELAKSSPSAKILRARLELARGKASDAVKLLEPLVAEEAESRSAATLTLYGDALYAAERVDTAAGAYDNAIELDEAYPDALIGRAVAAMRASKPDPALAWLNRADVALGTHARPPRVRALWMLTMGRAELQKNQLTPALDHLARAVAYAGVPNEAYFWYGEALAKSKSDKANEQYARYLSLEPEGPYAARAKKAASAGK